MACDYMPTKPAPKFGPKPKKLDFTKGIKGQSSRRKSASKVKF